MAKKKRKSKSGKGSAFERWFCTELSKWWTNGERDDVFWRTSGSGARATTRSKKGKTTARQYGDVHEIDPIGKEFIDWFTIELKRGYSSTSIMDLLDGGETTQFAKWILQAHSNANAAGNDWMLIVKRDRREAMVFCNHNYFVDICDEMIEAETCVGWILGFRLSKLFELNPTAFKKHMRKHHARSKNTKTH